MKKSKSTASLAALAALVGTIGVSAASSSDAEAALTTRCVGEAGAVTVPGDLVVPAGKSCALYGTVIEGTARVQQGADLLLRDGASVTGDLILTPNAFADVTGSTIGGRVVGRGAYGAQLDGAAVTGGIQFRANANFEGITSLVVGETSVGGTLDSHTGEVIVESSQLGALTSINAELTDLVDTVVNGDVTVRRNLYGAMVCASEVYGNAAYQQNEYGVQLGTGGALGPCDGANYWAGNVVVARNAGNGAGVDVSDNIIAGTLSGAGNNPAPTGAGNRVRGGAAGQFVELAPAATAAAPEIAQQRTATVTATAEATAEATPRGQADELIAARQAAATTQAEVAGPADIGS